MGFMRVLVAAIGVLSVILLQLPVGVDARNNIFSRNQGTPTVEDARRFRLPFLKRKGRSAAESPPEEVCIPARSNSNDDKQSFLQKHPFSSAVLITTCNAVAADLLTQRLSASSQAAAGAAATIATDWWNPQRSMLFAIFGFAFQGCAQYAIVNLFWEKLIPGASIPAVVKKIFGMNCVSDVILFFPCFYAFQQVLQQSSASGIQWATIFPKALQTYRSQCVSDWRNSWMIWFPGHAVTYGLLPPHQRIPWMACLSFVYMCILSWTRG